MRIVDGIRSSFRYVRNMENVTWKEIEDLAFVNECVDKNFAFLKSLPNSLPSIFDTSVSQGNKRELRVTLRNKRESRVTLRKKRVSRVTKIIREASRNKGESRVTKKNFEKQKRHTSKVVLRL
ncbi:hypothetical protein AVEN_81598-1 [Araneus ventricosus]|uniref:Uncharacterized protein n=1 Tax=Araneus ventricosus TaxID=182803 RepID=A0A4Y2FR11_ARAVE|nr:hypothetical protein AVEN_81598-1 [Araneus ventricosus]